jgi:CheY-like chemotaxis protein
MKILIADDDLVSLRMLQRVLESADYEVLAVANGQVAAEQI